ncbi:MAG: nitroreductase family protein [Coprobacter sp.]|nr:nitroreductase family protein [Coprobacter sp.]
MKSFLELVAARQSDRRFDAERPVEPEKLARILEAARLAPSACNSQPWRFIVIDDVDVKNRVADAAANRVLGMNHFTKQAPVHIVVVEVAGNVTSTMGGWVKDKNFRHIDIGIAAAHIALAAADEGLGSCIVGWFNEAGVRKVLGIPAGKRVLLDVVIGYSCDPHREKSRKPIDKTVTHNKY